MSHTRGDARSTGPAHPSIVESDPTRPPSPLLEEAYQWLDAEEVDVARYTSQEFHDLDAAKLWPSTWQQSCRLEHIPEIGDHTVYEICDQSIIVDRCGIDEVKAFHNSCLHRSTTLVDGTGKTAFFKCPFHRWAWNLDGTFRGMPASWDFPHVEGPELSLPEAQVAIWGGFVRFGSAGGASVSGGRSQRTGAW